MILFGISVLADVIKVRVSKGDYPRPGCSLNPRESRLLRQKRRNHRDREEAYVKTDTEIRVIDLQAKEH